MDWLKNHYRVVAYEPERQAFQRYREIKSNDFVCYNEAVSGSEGTAVLHVNGSTGGNSTILPLSEYDSLAACNSYMVKVVALNDVLERLGEVDVLDLNCEGSEIAIIMCTSLDNLARCKKIVVEFHKFRPSLNITDEMVQSCVAKLRKRFVVVDKQTYHPIYDFTRREDK